MAEEAGAEVFVRHQRASMGRADSRPHLAAIRCPTLVLVGDCDAITPVDAAEEIAAGVAGARLVVVPQCGHLAPVERPRALAEALVEWIER
jgi:pimeloyl-ACP methyl ester carboxylesterase